MMQLITRDQETKDFYSAGAKQQTIAVNIGVGTTALIVLSSNQNNSAYSSITANGTSMTELFDVTSTPGHRMSIYTLEEPPTGAYNVVVNVADNTNGMMTWVYSLKGTKTTDFIDGYGYTSANSGTSATLSSPSCVFPRSTWWVGVGASGNAFTYPYSGSATEVDTYNTGYKTTLFDTSAAGESPAWWNTGISFTTDTDSGANLLFAVGISGIITSPFPCSIY